MRRLVVWNAMTLDGYFEGRTPWDLGFHETVWGDELEAFSLEQGQEIGTLLFGRRTYEGMAAYWTKATGGGGRHDELSREGGRDPYARGGGLEQHAPVEG
jgi:dihydrofolate reductase